MVAMFIGPTRGDLGEKVAGHIPSESGFGLLDGLRKCRGKSVTIGIASDAAINPVSQKPLSTLLSLSGESESWSEMETVGGSVTLRPLDLRRRKEWPSGKVATERPFYVLLRRRLHRRVGQPLSSFPRLVSWAAESESTGLQPMAFCLRGLCAKTLGSNSQMVKMSRLTRKRMAMATTMISDRLVSILEWAGGAAAQVGEAKRAAGCPMILAQAQGQFRRGCFARSVL